jgi:Cdc6-like AAA superfamily ATPase
MDLYRKSVELLDRETQLQKLSPMTSYQDMPKVKMTHIKQMISIIFGNFHVQKIGKLTLHQKLVLATLSLMFSHKKTDISLSKVSVSNASGG